MVGGGRGVPFGHTAPLEGRGGVLRGDCREALGCTWCLSPVLLTAALLSPRRHLLRVVTVTATATTTLANSEDAERFLLPPPTPAHTTTTATTMTSSQAFESCLPPPNPADMPAFGPRLRVAAGLQAGAQLLPCRVHLLLLPLLPLFCNLCDARAQWAQQRAGVLLLLPPRALLLAACPGRCRGCCCHREGQRGHGVAAQLLQRALLSTL
mmetsp:Transcript_10328/g.26903  ORF Transcript_10328/g.26903 Transcript_10328/m.26903 type:complete len:210 (+) Transcript_10328:379-1008(+)